MELITNIPFINCTKCKEKTNAYYLDICVEGKICIKCLVNKHGNFPKGKGVHIPCELCTEPNIHWFYRPTYGKTSNKSDCGNHGCDFYNSDGDEISLGIFSEYENF